VEDSFVCGPVDLSFKPAELVFLVGGNGSGKTTLAKLLTGLYVPEAGEVRLNGTVVTGETREHYRQLFATVFADFYLFDSLLGLHVPELDEQARHYLTQLQLDHKVQVKDRKFSTTELSQGQRKRLALLTAYLEDRPFYIFDEWAADQDPHFKEIFYLQLLPELKAKGKTVLVISHDERYYHIADRVVRLDYRHVE
jgi:putative ATP-binding cassette transporter